MSNEKAAVTRAERPRIDWNDGVPVENVLSEKSFEQLKAAYLYDERQRIVDAVFAEAATRGWCYEVLAALDVAFPEGSPWSDGVWRNTQGHDVYGFDTEGYHHETGFNDEGVNRAGETNYRREWCESCREYHRR